MGVLHGGSSRGLFAAVPTRVPHGRFRGGSSRRFFAAVRTRVDRVRTCVTNLRVNLRGEPPWERTWRTDVENLRGEPP
jgi:hypothetical protein